MVSDYIKELPSVPLAMKPFWDGAEQGKLMLYKCLNCGSSFWPAVDCAACDNPRMSWVEATGKGEIFTFTVEHQLNHPGWETGGPYNIAWIKLDEGPILISNIIGCKNEELSIGMKVEVAFDRITPGVTLPRFKPF
jgi:uncharacterized OB-fold protein